MRLAVISTPVFSCPPKGYSGLEFLAWQTAEGLAKKGHDVSLFAPDGSTCEHSKLIPIGPPGTWDEKRVHSKIWPELLKFDCIIDETWQKWSMLLKVEGRLPKTPIVCPLHAPVNTMYQTLPPVDKPCFVCISQDQANHFEALHGYSARVVHNGVDLDFYKPMDIPRTKRHLFVARFSTIKGPDLSIEVCKRAGVGLDLVGDQSITGEPEYLEKCKAMCDGQQIKMVGPASRGECVWWFSQAHAFSHLNQRFREPYGLAPVEAQACGLPVGCWNYGAMRETVRQGETGFLVTSLNEIVDLIRNGAFDSINRARCREWVSSSFSVQRMIDGYEKLCIEALDTGGW